MIKTEFIIPLIVAVIMISGCSEKIQPGEHAAERPDVAGVVVEEVRLLDVMNYYEATGTVRAKNTSRVSAKIMGEVKDIHVIPGDRVRKGDVLLAIHSSDIELKVEAAAEALGEAVEGLNIAEESRKLMNRTYQRYLRLYEERGVTDQQFDEIKAKKEIAHLQHEQAQRSLKKAEAALKEAEAVRGYTVIRSPVHGIIAEKTIDRGTMTAPGKTLFIIEEAPYRVTVPVDEGLLPVITLAMPVEIYIHALNLRTDGSIAEVVRQIDPQSRTFTVKIDLNDDVQSLRGGLFALVKFPAGKESGLFVNESSIVSRGELRGVYVVDDAGIITFRFVRTGKKTKGMMEILSGLNSGEKIIVTGTDRAVDGGRVIEG
jgi:RND family efflux transporter MFP subunit